MNTIKQKKLVNLDKMFGIDFRYDEEYLQKRIMKFEMEKWNKLI